MNVILFDWTRAADQPFQQAAANTRGAGRILAMVVDSLKREFETNGHEFDLGKVHLVGFSLGGHAVGYAGKWINTLYPTKNVHDLSGKPLGPARMDKSNFRGIGKITGLDPAGIGFDTSMPSYRLNRYDAKFVEVIHTQWGFLE